MIEQQSVWLLCLVGGTRFPNLSVLGVYTSKEKLGEALRALPRDQRYNIYKAPLNEFLGYWHKSGQVQDGMGRLEHDHLMPPDPDHPDDTDLWASIEMWLADE